MRRGIYILRKVHLFSAVNSTEFSASKGLKHTFELLNN
jgi:hypothetical protein